MCVFSKCKYVVCMGTSFLSIYLHIQCLNACIVESFVYFFFHYFFGREMWILIDEMKCRYFFSVVIKRLLVTSY